MVVLALLERAVYGNAWAALYVALYVLHLCSHLLTSVHKAVLHKPHWLALAVLFALLQG